MTSPISQSRPPSRIVDPEGSIALCAPRLQDAGMLIEAIHESLAELKAFMPWAHLEQTVDGQYDRLVTACAAYWAGKDYTFHLFDPDEPGRLLGCVGLHRRAMNRAAIEIGYWVRTSAAGRGLCTRAVRALLVVGFEHLGFKRMQCGFDIDNAASARVNAKVGFTVEGDLKGYGPAGTDAMRADGWIAAEVNRMTSMDPEMARAQPWYGPTRDRLQVFDWMGRPV